MQRMPGPAVVAAVGVAVAFVAWVATNSGEPDPRGTVPVVTAAPEPAGPDPTRPPGSTDGFTVEDLLARFEPDADGRVSAGVTGTELTALANAELPPDSPVERVDLTVGRGGGRPRVDFTAALRGQSLDVDGAVALDLRQGTVEPELVEARVGPLPLTGGLRDPVDAVVDDAAAVFDAVAARGVVITSLRTDGDALRVEGRMDPGA
jgi:hypothetical protein